MEETIAAISTPPGEGGIGIVRISGEDAEKILSRVFHPASGKKPAARMLTYGHVVDPGNGETIDEVMAVFFPAPGTYTREDVAEIDCHGGVVPLRKTLSLVLREGARLARPGEFTERAFLNGRLDLPQAEAVMDLISAKSDRGYDAAMSQLSGALSGEIRKIRAQMMDELVDLTVNIDYPDEDIEILTYQKLQDALEPVAQALEELLASAGTGRIFRDGLRTAIIGKPNVGKSSLMNRFLRDERAIVTDIPGTTRDTIEETCSVRGIPVVLVDTAGIRKTGDRIEAMGVERSRTSAQEADLVLFVADGSRPIDGEDREILASLDPSKTILIRNKTDLPTALSEEELTGLLPGARVISCCMKDGSGISELEDAIQGKVLGGSVRRQDTVIVTDARHQALLQEALGRVRECRDLAGRREPFEIIELALEDAYEKLGEIIGETVTDDILNEVFSRFCLGK